MKTVYYRIPRRVVRTNWGFIWLLLGDLVFWVLAVWAVWALVS